MSTANRIIALQQQQREDVMLSIHRHLRIEEEAAPLSAD
jgi:hypothetical protein